MQTFDFNTAISQLMIFANAMEKEQAISKNSWESFLLLLAPFAPHITEELWHCVGEKESVHAQAWPLYNPELLVQQSVQFIIQVNGKVRDTIEVDANLSKEETQDLALQSEKVKKWIAGNTIKRVIFVPKKLVNIVIA